jgi:hypothetical protein
MDFAPPFKSFPLLLIASLLAFAPAAWAQDASATATLSETSTRVGEAVTYQITVSGARRADPPRQIDVDGLSISYAGHSTQVQMRNFDMTMSVVLNYSVLPQREGDFTIPAQTINAGGQRLTTNEVTLHVTAGTGGSRGNAGAAPETGDLAFAEIVIPKEQAFVGEAVPVELRIHVDARVRWNLEQAPQLQGDGFTAQKFTEPTQSEVTRDGRTYDLVIFKTAITPVKTGAVTLGPLEINALANIPQRRPRPRFGIDDFDALFNDPFGAFTQRQKLSIKSEPVQIQVRPLPPGAPKSFSGAVGQFSLSAAASPTKLRFGDPLTLTLKVTGRGNFDRVAAPVLTDENGWRAYPPSGSFKADDNVGISGTKTFEMAVIPEEPATVSPPVEFSYFDPLGGKYVTLKGEQTPIEVTGGKTQPPAAPAQSSPAPAPPGATPASSPAPDDIHYIRTDLGRTGVSFVPLHRRAVFWLAQLAPLAGLICLIGLRIRARRASDSQAQELARLRREKAEALRLLRSGSIDAGEFYDAAARAIQIETALKTGVAPGLVDADAACASREIDPGTAKEIRALFDARAEALYAGRAAAAPVPPGLRESILHAIQTFSSADHG